MEITHKILFENLDSTHYTSTKEAINEYRIFKRQFSDLLGYDEKTNGFVALQRGHQRGALPDELPSVAILKDNGHAVILLAELGEGKHLDCTIDGMPSELKCVKTFTIRSIKEDFYGAYKKGAIRIVVHIDVPIERIALNTVLKRVAYNPLVNKIKDVFLIFENKLERYQLDDFK